LVRVLRMVGVLFSVLYPWEGTRDMPGTGEASRIPSGPHLIAFSFEIQGGLLAIGSGEGPCRKSDTIAGKISKT
jgi:hypothetical protein